jgi:predicted DNA binding protein
MKPLVAALDYGYFDISREVSLEEFADEPDLSHQALSDRLLRV